jgi:hypothetical protein
MDDVPFSRRLIRGRARGPRRSRARGVVRRGFTNSVLALSSARRHVRQTIAGWQLTDDEQDIVVLVANELVSNAVKHAQTTSRMTLRRSRRVVHVLVRDYSADPPQSATGDSGAGEAAGCHGLQVVGAASSRWGWHRHTIGKTVWATITVANPYRFA